jgi:hypothetical protein
MKFVKIALPATYPDYLWHTMYMSNDYNTKGAAAAICLAHTIKMQEQADRLIRILKDEGMTAEAAAMSELSATCEIVFDALHAVPGIATGTAALREIAGVDA